MSNFDLNIIGASGSSIPYISYIEAQVSMSDIDHDPLTVPILYVSTTRFSGQVPIIVGTNIFAAFKDHGNGTASVPLAWNNAFYYIPKRMHIHFALEKPCNIFCILHGVKCILHGVKESRSLVLFLF